MIKTTFIIFQITQTYYEILRDSNYNMGVFINKKQHYKKQTNKITKLV